MSAGEMMARFEAGGSPEQELDQLLMHIAAKDGIFNSFVLVDEAGARAAAARSAARWRNGAPLSPIDGLPITIKDMLPVKGLPLRNGSLVTSPEPSAQSAPVVERLINAGAVIVGLTTTAEFGGAAVTISPLTGVTRNAHDPSRTAGGSSGGAAVSVAAGFAAAAIATDTGGSIRIPAAMNGVVGLKPTGGRLPTSRASVLHTLGCPGPITRNVADCARIFSVMADQRFGSKRRDEPPLEPLPPIRLEDVRIIASRTLGYAPWLAPEVATSFDALIALLRDCGCEVREIEPSWTDPSPIFAAHTRANYASILADLDAADVARLSPQVRDARAAGQGLSVADLLKARAQREEFAAKVDQFLEGADILLTPTTAISAFEADRFVPSNPEFGDNPRAWAPFGYPFNLSRHPALTLPCGASPGGLPVGCQLVARHFEESFLLAVGGEIEKQLQRKSSPARQYVQ